MDLKDKKLFLLDMDGTIYLGDRLFAGTSRFLKAVNEKGGRCIFMTNNSSKSAGDYVEKLSKMGIKADISDFVTSADASVWFLKKKLGSDFRKKKMYVMGTASLIKQMKEEGFRVADEAGEDIELILCAFDRELTYRKLEDVCRMLSEKQGLPYYATNPDWVCPTEFGYVPDCGSMCKMIEKATGRSPVFIGKPQPLMALLAMEITGFSQEETLVVGDRLYTDIACGYNAGVETCFVLSGEGTTEDLESSEVKPTYVFTDINQLYRRIKDET